MEDNSNHSKFPEANGGKKSIFKADRFSPRYFRNLGVGVIIGWALFNGGARLVLPEEKQQAVKINPLPFINELKGALVDSECQIDAESIGKTALKPILEISNGTNRPEDLSKLISKEVRQNIDQAVEPSQVIEILNTLTQSKLGAETTLSEDALYSLKNNRDFGFFDTMQNKDRFSVFKNASYELYEQISYLPKELFEYANIKELSIVVTNDKTHFGFSESQSGSTKISLSIAGFYSSFTPHTFNHELGHALDNRMCGENGIFNDSGFTSLNSFGYFYGVENYSALSLNALSTYSLTNPAEDKAELYAYLLSKNKTIQLEDLPDPLRAKAKLLMIRLEANVPGITSYLFTGGEKNV